MRWLFLTFSLPLLLPAQDAGEIIRRSIQGYERNYETAKSYSFLVREEKRTLDSDGRIKERKIETFETLPIEGSPYRRLVARNDQPLSSDEAKYEQAKLSATIDERRKETPEQRAKRIQDWEKRQDERGRDFVMEIPEAFDFRIVKEETLSGAEVWLIEGTPKRGFKGKAKMARAVFPNVNCRFWVSKKDYAAARVEVDTVRTVSIGLVIFRLAKGTRIIIDQMPVNSEGWFPKRIWLQASGRIMMVKGYWTEQLTQYSDYKKSQTEARVLDSQDPQSR